MRHGMIVGEETMCGCSASGTLDADKHTDSCPYRLAFGTKPDVQPVAAGRTDAPATHELKTDPELFDAVWRGDKTHEIRLNDRDYRVGDSLFMRETKSTGYAMRRGDPLVYTGRESLHTVTHVLTGYGLQPGWVILSLRMTRKLDIRALVNRFLTWRLPQTVAADGCATNNRYEFPRYGTNLLTADEAEKMLKHVLDGSV